MTSRITFLLILVGVVASACGGDDTSAPTAAPTTEAPTTTTQATTTTMGRDADLFEAVVTSLDSEVDPNELVLERSEAECIAEATFDAVGEDRWVEIGIDAGAAEIPAFSTIEANFTDAEWTLATDALFSCVDVEAEFVETLVEGEFPRATAECTAATLIESGALRLLIGTRDGTSPEAEAAFLAFQEAAAACAG